MVATAIENFIFVGGEVEERRGLLSEQRVFYGLYGSQ